MSDAVADRLANLLTHPKISPFGNHIPTTQEVASGKWDNPITVERLNALHFTFDHDADSPAIVHSIGEPLQENVEIIRRMEADKMLPGAKVLVDRSRTGIEISVVGHENEPLKLDLLDARSVFVVDDTP